MYAIRRDLFEPLPTDTILDDFIISMNIAKKRFRIVYEEQARGCEGKVNRWHEEFWRQSKMFAGVFQSLKRGQGVPDSHRKSLLFCYLSHKLLRWLTPSMLVVCFVATPAVGIGWSGHDLCGIADCPASLSFSSFRGVFF